ncbi:2-polyprenyl-6-hydroxyphenyl methylase / 3-demethylubiquinone-9 3-methyltransferase [Desulfuromusa kysingii]|uniref:2-polyprenyl-6-hydroxyphenyl methylase / 3-demethylubiquinone-9 3-methyltransferase n=1 Tax=Desulfuromusa kysingii TaxID=37625 RepID=A0A1H3VZX1_9BACT|nr:class I SAM-dependent methyltransferase [Desulfuromusa kysingii]SDZ80349.1 2-polyprenyl-6-hydroxyphenyl methylase / 3-demethylubiquinone-9 3-methyltransferase [Desulfuromusa kysingii]
MTTSEYNFERCKLCGQHTAAATYDLISSMIYVCHNCDFHFLNYLDTTPENRNNSMPLNSQNQQYLQARADENAHLHQSRLQLVLNHMHLSGAKVLDIGAGLGQFQLLLNAQGASCHGIEPSTIRREYARKMSEITLHAELVDDNYWQTTYQQYFDAITLWDVIEHVNFPKETLEAACQLLKPGGRLFLDTPSRSCFTYRISQRCYRYLPGKTSLFLPGFYSTAPYGHKQIFTRAQLTKLMTHCGLEIISSARSYPNQRFSSNKIILAGSKI